VKKEVRTFQQTLVDDLGLDALLGEKVRGGEVGRNGETAVFGSNAGNSVQVVSNDWTAEGGHVHPELVSSPGHRGELYTSDGMAVQ
tara:strand:- start:280 stop:537 length:258 start_codon:yes stop_codon:yes gene_type:complete